MGIMEKKMETTINCAYFGFRVYIGFRVNELYRGYVSHCLNSWHPPLITPMILPISSPIESPFSADSISYADHGKENGNCYISFSV